MNRGKLDLPQDRDAEAALLGSMLIYPPCIADVLNHLPRGSSTVFNLPAYRVIFDCLVNMWSNDQVIDIITLEDELKHAGGYDLLTRETLIQLSESVPCATNAPYYARVVSDKAIQRDLAVFAMQLNERAHAPDADVAELGEWAERELARIRGRSREFEPMQLGTLCDQLLADLKVGIGNTGLSTGFNCLDEKIGGLRAGEYLVVAAASSVGKTSFAVQILTHVFMNLRHPVALFSLEMSSRQIAKRMLSLNSRVPGRRIDRPAELTDGDWHYLEKVKLPDGFIVDDCALMTAMEFRARVKRLVQRHGIKLVALDYIGLIDGQETKNRTRNDLLTDASRIIKLTSQECGIPIIVMSQVNRNAEREDRPPGLHDLRDSGSIGQDADIVMVLHPKEKMDPTKLRPPQYDVYGMIRKQRNGPLGAMLFGFDSPTCSFFERADDGEMQ